MRFFLLSYGQELMDIVFDQKFAVVGEELPVSLGFENVIFVMEDVDAASPIVQSRDRSRRRRKKKRGTKTTVKVYITCSYSDMFYAFKIVSHIHIRIYIINNIWLMLYVDSRMIGTESTTHGKQMVGMLR